MEARKFYNLPDGSAIPSFVMLNLDEAGNVIPIPEIPVVLAATTLTKDVFELSGDSETLVAAGVGTGKVFIRNPIGNDPIAIGLAGEEVALDDGWPVVAGGTAIIEPGLANAITVIGTATQTVLVYSG